WRTTRGVLLATPLRRTLLAAPELHGTAASLAQRVAENDVVLHGASRPDIDELRPAPQTDFDGAGTNAVFATDDAIWSIFFAIVNRKVTRSLVNACLRVRGESRYFFSISEDPADPRTWSNGWVYVLPRATFRRHASGPEWLSPVTVRPDERIAVT